nr:hypothetical protein [Catenulispora rubra]
MTIRVLLADEQDLVRAGFRMLIDSESDRTVVAEASDGAEAVHLAREIRAGPAARPDSLNPAASG